MKKSNGPSRREFIKQSTMAGSAMILPTNNLVTSLLQNELTGTNALHISIFSKQLQFLDYNAMSEAVKEMGFEGVDLTIRPKGHVLPERVLEDLPKATEAMMSYGLKPGLLTTNVDDALNPIHKKVVETASQLGYQNYRIAWFKYTNDKDILDTVAYAKNQLNGLAELNEIVTIRGDYQNHSGHYFGSGIWDLYQVINQFSSSQIGNQYDIMHAVVEGGRNWEVGLKLIKSHINSIVLKDFLWKKKEGKWVVHYVPLGEGMVDFNRFFSLLKEYNINVPFTIHAEYDLGGAEHGRNPTIDKKEVFNKLQKDLQFARQTYAEAE